MAPVSSPTQSRRITVLEEAVRDIRAQTDLFAPKFESLEHYAVQADARFESLEHHAVQADARFDRLDIRADRLELAVRQAAEDSERNFEAVGDALVELRILIFEGLYGPSRNAPEVSTAVDKPL